MQSTKLSHSPAKIASMVDTIRWVNIRGYVRKIKVSHFNEPLNGWFVYDKGRMVFVNEEDFYHEYQGLLIPRTTPEFMRKYPGHPVEIVNVPCL